LKRLFEPLGYTIQVQTLPLDERFAAWGESKAVNLTIEKTTTLKELLSQLYVFILALDNERHYWISQNDVEILMRRGEGWLESHPEKEWITRRFFKNLRSLTNQALLRLAPEEEFAEEEHKPKAWVSLHEKRLQRAYELLKQSGATTVLDLGCGEGKLMKKLIKDSQFKRIVGMDVSFRGTTEGKRELVSGYSFTDDAGTNLAFSGSVTYKDDRMKGFDAVALVEVIEHIDEERLLQWKRWCLVTQHQAL
jgi:3' terminal RNA ribose 2'-O-methyltransferase Hen1